jgi:hypothetical protein
MQLMVDLGRVSGDGGGGAEGAVNEEGMELLYFLADHSSFETGWSEYAKLSEFQTALAPYFKEDSQMVALLTRSLAFESIDAFFDFMNSLMELTYSSPDVPTNGLSGVAMVGKESALGIALRRTLVRWHGMTLDQGGDLFESVHAFLQGKQTGMGDDGCGSGGADRGATKLTAAIKDALRCKDYSSAVEHIHQYYDLGQQNPITNMNNMPPAALLGSSGPNPYTRHQEAMLTLGDVWLSGEQFQLALTAVEEALKTAHQRDDHESIACSLLLLHRVLLRSHASNVNKHKLLGEQAIMRCLMRCLALSLDGLSAEAALSLAHMRCHGPLVPVASAVLGRASLDDTQLAMVKESPQALWMTLSACQMRLMRIVHLLASPGVVPPAEAQGKERLSKIISNSDVWTGNVSLHLRTFHTAAELWVRLGHINMAVQACLRGVAVWNGGVEGEEPVDLVRLVCFLAKLLTQMHVDGTVRSQDPSVPAPERLPCDAIVAFLSHVQQVYQSCLSPDLEAELLVATHVARAQHLLGCDRLEEALSSVAAAIELHSNSSSTENGAHQKEVLRMYLFQAEILYQSGCTTSSLVQASHIVAAASTAGFSDLEGQALLLQARVQGTSHTEHVERLASDAFLPGLTGLARLNALQSCLSVRV